MDIFPQVGVFLAQNGFISILKKMPGAAVSFVEITRMSGQQASHNGCDGNPSGFQQQMSVVGYQCPCIAACICFGDDTADSI